MVRKVKILTVCLLTLGFFVTMLTVSATFAADTFKVAIVLPGSINDESNNQAGYEGLKVIEKELGAEVAYSEKVAQPDQEVYLLDYARRGYDLVIGHGGEFDDATAKAAKKFPNVKFFVTNGAAKGPNIAHGTVNIPHYAYICGIVAAKMTKTNKIALVSGNEIPPVLPLIKVLKKALADYNPKAELGVIYTGSWDDVAKAKEATYAQVAKGVDVIFPALDLATLGVIEAAREKNVYTFGFVKDLLDVAPNNVLCSAIMNYSAVLLHVAKLVKEGKFVGGTAYYLGLETPGVTGTGRFSKVVPQEVKAEVSKAIQDIVAGKIQFD